MARHLNASRKNNGKRWVNCYDLAGCVKSINQLFRPNECDCQVRGTKLGTRAELESRSFKIIVNKLSAFLVGYLRGMGQKRMYRIRLCCTPDRKLPSSEFTLGYPVAALWHWQREGLVLSMTWRCLATPFGTYSSSVNIWLGVCCRHIIHTTYPFVDNRAFLFMP